MKKDFGTPCGGPVIPFGGAFSKSSLHERQLRRLHEFGVKNASRTIHRVRQVGPGT